MDFLRNLFIRNYNMEMVVNDLMDLIDEDKLMNYIYNKFKKDFMYGEIYNLLKNEMNKEDMETLLTDMGHDFVDIDELEEEEKEKYY